MCKLYNLLSHLTIHTVDIFSFELTQIYLTLLKNCIVFRCTDEKRLSGPPP